MNQWEDALIRLTHLNPVFRHLKRKLYAFDARKTLVVFPNSKRTTKGNEEETVVVEKTIREEAEAIVLERLAKAEVQRKSETASKNDSSFDAFNEIQRRLARLETRLIASTLETNL